MTQVATLFPDRRRSISRPEPNTALPAAAGPERNTGPPGLFTCVARIISGRFVNAKLKTKLKGRRIYAENRRGDAGDPKGSLG
jgi:hypothetical protein